MKNELETEEPVTDVTIINDTPFDYRNLIRLVNEKSITTKEKTRQFGEVYTPVTLIEKMCDAFQKEMWSDPTKTILDPCCGRGNIPAVIVTRLVTVQQYYKEIGLPNKARSMALSIPYPCFLTVEI